MTDSLKITLPLPDRALHAHAKGTWRTKVKPTRRYRERAYAEALSICNRRPNVTSAVIDVVFYYPDAKRRDVANSLQSIKPGIDGLVDAGWIRDDDFKHVHYGAIWGDVDRASPRVEITVKWDLKQ